MLPGRLIHLDVPHTTRLSRVLVLSLLFFFFFFFQAEDGIRDWSVTGVQTCALPILAALNHPNIATIFGLEQSDGMHFLIMELVPGQTLAERLTIGPIGIEEEIGRASCRERV